MRKALYLVKPKWILKKLIFQSLYCIYTIPLYCIYSILLKQLVISTTFLKHLTDFQETFWLITCIFTGNSESIILLWVMPLLINNYFLSNAHLAIQFLKKLPHLKHVDNIYCILNLIIDYNLHWQIFFS